MAGSAVPILNRSPQRNRVALARSPESRAMPMVSATVASPAFKRWSRISCSFDSWMPRCRATMTRLPSSEPVGLSPSSNRVTVEGLFNAKVTVSTISS
jgi:hypothetical protein